MMPACFKVALQFERFYQLLQEVLGLSGLEPVLKSSLFEYLRKPDGKVTAKKFVLASARCQVHCSDFESSTWHFVGMFFVCKDVSVCIDICTFICRIHGLWALFSKPIR
jgi:hypothetical protein